MFGTGYKEVLRDILFCGLQLINMSPSGIRLCLSLLVACLLTAAQAHEYLNYSTVMGYFLQDEASTNASTFNYVRTYNNYASRQRSILANSVGRRRRTSA